MPAFSFSILTLLKHSLQGIHKKLVDAPFSDWPRFGDYPGKTEPKFIKRLIQNGLYFDRRPIRTGGEVNVTSDPDYAPPYVLSNQDHYGYLLHNPYRNIDLTRVGNT